MCVIPLPPEPVYSSIEIFDANTGASIRKFIGQHQILIHGLNDFEIYQVVSMNPTTTGNAPVFSTANMEQLCCAECLDGIFDDIPETEPVNSNGNSTIIPLPPDSDSDNLEVFLAKKFYKSYNNVTLHEGKFDFRIHKNDQILACYTKKGFTHRP